MPSPKLPFAVIIIRDDPAQIKSNYKRISQARKGVAEPTDLTSVALLTTLNTKIAAQSTTFINVPPIGSTGLSSTSLVLRLEPAPETLSISTSAESQAEPILYSPLPASYSRVPGTRSISVTFMPDSIITPKVMGFTREEWRRLAQHKNWLSDYITFIESLSVTLPGLGRKPWLAFKYGWDIYGVGQFGLQLESIETETKWSNPNGIAQAEVRLRFREYMVI